MTNTASKPGRPAPWEKRVLGILKSVLPGPGARPLTLLVGVSGGTDSVCLLHLLAGWRSLLNISLHAAHVDHGLRGSDSDADREYVIGLCRELGVPLSVEKVDLSLPRRKHSPLEEVAREARYSFFARIAGELGSDIVAVGHTADDQLETVLLHLVRGTGTRGLAGMDHAAGWQEGGKLRILRPLLNVRRRETEEYCDRFDLRPRMDTSNLSPAYLRNRVRMELLPLLRELNPGFDRLLLQTAAIARDDIRSLEIWAAELWPRIARTDGESLRLDRKKLAVCPPGLKRVLLLRAIEQSLGGLRDIHGKNVDALIGALKMPAGKVIELPGGVMARTRYGELVLSRTTDSPFPGIGAEYALNIPGQTSISGWTIRASVMERESGTGASQEDPFCAVFDLQSAGTRLTVRARRDGDRFQPLGMSGTRKLQDFMVDARVPVEWRRRVPLVCSKGHIVWVVGWRIDDRVKVTESTRNVLVLQFRLP